MEARRQWKTQQPSLSKSRLVFIDETGSNAAMCRRFGYARIGTPAVIQAPLHAAHHSLVGAMTSSGLLTSMLVKGAVDGAAFLVFLKECLVPHLKPGDVVVMDNVRTHKVKGVRELVEGAGATVAYQPPYSPDLNPIELLWGFVKRLVRGLGPRSVDNLIEAFRHAFSAIKPEHCAAWFRACGYDTQQV